METSTSTVYVIRRHDAERSGSVGIALDWESKGC